jgi:hypothetical protein
VGCRRSRYLLLVKIIKPLFLSGGLLAATLPAQAAQAISAPSAIGWLMLPFALAFGVVLHLGVGRAIKVVMSSVSPLSEGEIEIGGYERRVYGTAVRPMQEIVLLALASGLAFWLGLAWSIPWGVAAGVLLAGGALALDLMRWERVSISVTYVWFQRGLGQRVHQVAMENIRDVNVVETEEPGFTLRHLNHNRLCRLTLRMQDKRVVALPKTDAYSELDAVEATANVVRERLLMLNGRKPASARLQENRDAGATTIPAVHNRAMMRELKRLRDLAAETAKNGGSVAAPAVAPPPPRPAPAPAVAAAPRPAPPRMTDMAEPRKAPKGTKPKGAKKPRPPKTAKVEKPETSTL